MKRIILLGLIAIIATASCTETPVGIDVSHHQGTIDWDGVSSSGIQYVYIKATEGSTFTDPKFSKNIKEAKASGLHVGAYHFYSETSSIKKQFEHFKSKYPKETADLIPMLDVEPKGRASKSRRSSIQSDVKEFQKLCKDYYGKEPVLYIAPVLAEVTWLASLIDSNTVLCIGHPYKTAPRLKGGKQYSIWQYTYSGKINGIPGSVDLHKFNKGMTVKKLLID